MTPERAQLEEEILDITASAEAAGHDSVEDIMAAKNVPPDAAISFLLRKGLSSMLKEQRARDRLQIKVLDLNPMHYERIKQSIEEQDAAPDRARELARKRREEEARTLASSANFKRISGEFEKMRIALEFYERWVLPDGTHLGDATRGKLLAEASRERASADGHHKNAMFYEALMREMGNQETVRDGVPLDRAHRIREQIYGAEASMAA